MVTEIGCAWGAAIVRMIWIAFFSIVICCVKAAQTTDTNSILLEISSSWQPITSGNGYNISLVCSAICNSAAYHVNVSLADSTLSWFDLTSVSVPYTGATALLGNLSQSSTVMFIGRVKTPVIQGDQKVAHAYANWTTASRSNSFSTKLVSTPIYFSRGTNLPPGITVIRSTITEENQPVSLFERITIADDDFTNESDNGVMTVTVSTTNDDRISLDLSRSVFFGANILIDTPMKIVFSCPLNCANLTLQEIVFTPTSDWTGLTVLNVTVSDNGNGGVGLCGLTTMLVNISVIAVNQHPRITLSAAAFTVHEDSSLLLSNFTYTDPDAAALDNVTMLASALYGTFSFFTPVAVNFSLQAHSMIAWGPHSLMHTTVFQSFFYIPPLHWSTPDDGFDMISFTITDGHGASSSKFATLNIISATYMPSVDLISKYTTAEDTPLNIYFSVHDAEIDKGRGQEFFIETKVIYGGLSLAPGLPGLSIIVNTNSWLQFYGDTVATNQALNPVIYTPFLDWSGIDQLTISVRNHLDLWANYTISINVTAVNDAPQITISPAGPLNAVEHTPVEFSISVVDVDSANVTVQLYSIDGTFSVKNPNSASVSQGGLVVSGRQDLISAVLSNVTFTSHLYRYGLDCSARVNASDTNKAESLMYLPIYVAKKNNAPILTVPALLFSSEDKNLTISSMSVFDGDDDDLQLSLLASKGSLTLKTRAGLTFLVGDGLKDPEIIIKGEQSTLNAALHGMVFIPPPYFYGNVTISLLTNDTFLSSGRSNCTVIVAASDNGPDLICRSFTVNESTFTKIGSVVISDFVEVNQIMTMTAKTSRGILKTSTSVSQVSVLGNGTEALVLHGPFSQINAALDSIVQYRGDTTYNALCCGLTSITFNASYGNTSAICTSDVVVLPVDDPPVLSVCTILPAVLSTPASLGHCINMSDPDVGESDSSRHSLQLSAVDGVFIIDMPLVVKNGLRIENSTDHQIRISGLLTRLETAVDQNAILYNGTAGKAHADSISIILSDLASGNLVATTLPVTQMSNPPLVTLPSGYNVSSLEDTILPITMTVHDVDTAFASVIFNVSSSSSQSTLSLVSGSGVSIISHSSTNNLVLAIPVTYIPSDIVIGFCPALNWNSALQPPSVVSFAVEGTEHARVVISVVAVNDAPLVTVPADLSVNEDADISLDISISDVDYLESVGASIYVSLFTSPRTGTFLSLQSYFGVHVRVLEASRVDFNGSLSSVNDVLQDVTARFTSFFGNATLFVCVSDMGNTGLGGVQWQNVSTTVVVAHVNHPPVIDLVGSTLPVILQEDATRILNFTLTDADNKTEVIFLASIDGGTYLSGLIDGYSSVVGNFTSVADALTRVSITPNLNWNGVKAAFTINISDSESIELLNFPCVVTPVEDPPVVSLNCSNIHTVLEDTGRVLLPYDIISGITDGDYEPDDESQLFRLSLSVGNGTMKVLRHANSYFYSPLDFLLQVKSLQYLILEYDPNPNFNGPDTLSVQLNDTTGTSLSLANCSINVVAVNDPILILLPSDVVSVLEDVPTAIFPNVNISRAPYEDASTILSCTVTAVHGHISGSIAPTASTSTLQMAIRNLVYTPEQDSDEDDYVEIAISYANGAVRSDQRIKIIINAVNDSPTVSVPYASATVKQDNPLVIKGIQLHDVDSEEILPTLNISALHGSFTLNGTGGLRFFEATGGLSASGSLNALQLSVSRLIYAPVKFWFGIDIITISLTDQSSTATSTITITVQDVLDPVTISPANSEYSVSQGSSVAIGDMRLFDIDSSVTNCIITAASGTITPNSNYTWLTGAPFNGTFATNSTALSSFLLLSNAFTYSPSKSFSGKDTVLLTVSSPLGETTLKIAVRVTVTNVAPSLTMSTNQFSLIAGTTVNITGVGCTDPDIGGNPFTIAIHPTMGTTSFTSGGYANPPDGLPFQIPPLSIQKFWNAFEFHVPYDFSAGPVNITISVWDEVIISPITANITVHISASNTTLVSIVTITVPDIVLVDEDTQTAVITPLLINNCNDATTGNVSVTVSSRYSGTVLGSIPNSCTALSSESTSSVWRLNASTCSAVSDCLNGGLKVTPPANLNGVRGDLIEITIYRQQILIAESWVHFNITALNDAPSISSPLTGLLASTSTVQLGAGYYAGWPLVQPIIVSDIDADETYGSMMKFHLSVSNGTLSLLHRIGLSFITGNGLNDAVIEFYATKSLGNLALSNTSLVYNIYNRPSCAPGTVVLDILRVVIDDQGNTGLGGSFNDTASSAIFVTCL